MAATGCRSYLKMPKGHMAAISRAGNLSREESKRKELGTAACTPQSAGAVPPVTSKRLLALDQQQSPCRAWAVDKSHTNLARTGSWLLRRGVVRGPGSQARRA